MRQFPIILALLLAACNLSGTRYRDNAHLEHPPELPVDVQAREQIEANELTAPVRRHGKGLDSDVYRLDDAAVFKIKRGYDEAWSLVGRAIQQKDLKVPDQDRSKGNYYVAYDGGSLLGYSLFNDEAKTTYLVRLESEGDETKVTVSFANKDEQYTSTSAALKDGWSESPDDKSGALSELLYDTLHDDLIGD